MRKRDRYAAAVEDLLRSVSEPQLVTAIAMILAHRRRQAEGLSEDAMVVVSGSDVRPAEFLATANARHHQALVQIVANIRETGDLDADLSDDDAARIIYYHFRFEQFELVAQNFGWGEDRARDWIRERIELALLAV